MGILTDYDYIEDGLYSDRKIEELRYRHSREPVIMLFGGANASVAGQLLSVDNGGAYNYLGSVRDVEAADRFVLEYDQGGDKRLAWVQAAQWDGRDLKVVRRYIYDDGRVSGSKGWWTNVLVPSVQAEAGHVDR